jgi:predicted transcriptional regulator of viral defense system
MDNHIISSRFGYQLEMLGQSTGGLDAARGSVRLDPRKPAQGTFNTRWRVYINVSHQDLFPEGVA